MDEKELTPDVLGLKDLAQFSSFFSTKIGKWVGEKFLHLFKIDEINRNNVILSPFPVEEVPDRMMKMFGVKVVVEGEENLDLLKDTGFFSVSNHPFGSIDGITLTGLLLKHRKDAKVMVNDILMRISCLRDAFLGVTPQIGFKKNQTPSMLGMRAILKHIREGHPLGLFPAGAVSLYGKRDFIADRLWQPQIIKLVQQYKRPVIPIFFHGYNSPYFYNLERIHIALRTLFLPRQLFSKDGFTLKISVGEPISVEEQEQCSSVEELGLLLRRRTYLLSKDERLINSTE